MFLKQIEYFIAVVDEGNFTLAGERCHISQSAISQQIKSLEDELGTKLLDRHNRTFSLTEAGELFYRKATIILADIGSLKKEISSLDKKEVPKLKISYLNSYAGSEFEETMAEFSHRYPDIAIDVFSGNHEDLYNSLIRGEADLVINDQRRKFSEDYVNFELVKSQCFIEISSRHPFAKLHQIDVSDLKNTPCILIASMKQRENESSYYRDIVGFTGEHLYADDLRQARLMVVSGKGFLPVEVFRNETYFDRSVTRIPLYKRGQPFLRNYCAFWNKDIDDTYIRIFAELLKQKMN